MAPARLKGLRKMPVMGLIATASDESQRKRRRGDERAEPNGSVPSEQKILPAGTIQGDGGGLAMRRQKTNVGQGVRCGIWV